MEAADVLKALRWFKTRCIETGHKVGEALAERHIRELLALFPGATRTQDEKGVA